MNAPITLVWLHLSDLHLCEPKTGWDAHRVLDSLIDDLKKMQTDHDLQPDLMFFTGDAAFGNLGVGDASLEAQFQKVEQFFTRVRQAFSKEIPKENLFLVPGNHDVDRKKASQQLSSWLDQRVGCGEVRTASIAKDAVPFVHRILRPCQIQAVAA